MKDETGARTTRAMYSIRFPWELRPISLNASGVPCFCKRISRRSLRRRMRAGGRQVTWCPRPIRRTGDNEWVGRRCTVKMLSGPAGNQKENNASNTAEEQVGVMMRFQGTMRRSCLHGRVLGRRAGAEEGASPWSPARALEPWKSWKHQGLPEGRPCDQRTCSCTLHLPPTGSGPVVEGAARPALPQHLDDHGPCNHGVQEGPACLDRRATLSKHVRCNPSPSTLMLCPASSTTSTGQH